MGQRLPYIVLGATSVRVVNQVLHLKLDDRLVDTFSGVLMTKLGRIPETGDRLKLGRGASAGIVEVKDLRATRVRVTLPMAKK